MKDVLKLNVWDDEIANLIYISNGEEPLILNLNGSVRLVEPRGTLDDWMEAVSGLVIYEVPVTVAMKWPLEAGDNLEEKVIEHAREIAIQQGMHLEPFEHRADFNLVVTVDNKFRVVLRYEAVSA